MELSGIGLLDTNRDGSVTELQSYNLKSELEGTQGSGWDGKQISVDAFSATVRAASATAPAAITAKVENAEAVLARALKDRNESAEWPGWAKAASTLGVVAAVVGAIGMLAFGVIALGPALLVPGLAAVLLSAKISEGKAIKAKEEHEPRIGEARRNYEEALLELLRAYNARRTNTQTPAAPSEPRQ